MNVKVVGCRSIVANLFVVRTVADDDEDAAARHVLPYNRYYYFTRAVINSIIC